MENIWGKVESIIGRDTYNELGFNAWALEKGVQVVGAIGTTAELTRNGVSKLGDGTYKTIIKMPGLKRAMGAATNEEISKRRKNQKMVVNSIVNAAKRSKQLKKNGLNIATKWGKTSLNRAKQTIKKRKENNLKRAHEEERLKNLAMKHILNQWEKTVKNSKQSKQSKKEVETHVKEWAQHAKNILKKNNKKMECLINFYMSNKCNWGHGYAVEGCTEPTKEEALQYFVNKKKFSEDDTQDLKRSCAKVTYEEIQKNKGVLKKRGRSSKSRRSSRSSKRRSRHVHFN